MKKQNLEQLEFLTSLITAVLLFLVTYLQYSKGRSWWWLILIVSLMMAANAYVKYKNLGLKP